MHMPDSLVVFVGTYLIFVTLAVGFLYFLYTDRKIDFLLLGWVGVTLAFLVGKVAGLLWYNPLPFMVDGFEPLIAQNPGNGFVSDHTVVAAGVAAVFYFFDKRISAGLFAVAALIGLARVLGGVHHTVDVVGAFVVAVAAVAIARASLSRFGYLKEPRA